MHLQHSAASERGGILFGLLIVFAIGAAVYFAPHPLISWLGYALVVDQEPQGSDAIVVLLGGAGPERVLKAHELYRRGLAPRIVFGSGFNPKNATTPGIEWEAEGGKYRRALRSLGVPAANLVVVDTSTAHDTAGELSAIAEHFKRAGLVSAILVTSASHSRRSSLMWRRVAEDIPYFVVSAGEARFNHWWSDSYSRKRVAYEYGAFIKELPYQIGALVTRLFNYLNELRKVPEPIEPSSPVPLRRPT